MKFCRCSHAVRKKWWSNLIFYKPSFYLETSKTALRQRASSFDLNNQKLQHHWFVQHLPPCSWKSHKHKGSLWGWIYCFNHHPVWPLRHLLATKPVPQPLPNLIGILADGSSSPKPSGAISRFARWISGPQYFMLMYLCNSPRLF